jgi:hypothetical protein
LSMKEVEMTGFVYDVSLGWLAGWNRDKLYEEDPKRVKWIKMSEVNNMQKADAETEQDKCVGYQMMVWNGEVYQQWLEIRPSKVKAGYGLFACCRFERGDIISAEVPGESYGQFELSEEPPNSDNLNLGVAWAAVKLENDLRRASNAIYVEANGLLRARSRILPGSEILVDSGSDVSIYGMEYLDCVVMPNKPSHYRNWWSPVQLGKVVSGSKTGGYVVVYGAQRNRIHVTEEEVKKIAITSAYNREIEEEEERERKRQKIF